MSTKFSVGTKILFGGRSPFRAIIVDVHEIVDVGTRYLVANPSGEVLYTVKDVGGLSVKIPYWHTEREFHIDDGREDIGPTIACRQSCHVTLSESLVLSYRSMSAQLSVGTKVVMAGPLPFKGTIVQVHNLVDLGMRYMIAGPTGKIKYRPTEIGGLSIDVPNWFTEHEFYVDDGTDNHGH